MTPVRLTTQAKADIAKAAAYYEARSEGLGEKFTDRVLETVDRIETNPLGYATVIRDVRRANIPKFPFALWFRVVGDAVVIGCLDSRRHPVLAAERVAGVIEFPKPPEPV